METILEKIQKEIDRCNDNNGCDSKCSLSEQHNCWKLHEHEERCSFCEKNNIPLERW